MDKPDASRIAAPAPPPTLAVLFARFARISVLSVGGGLAAWIRRLVVEQERWLDEPHFLSGYALSQIAPGPNAVNLAVFVGATLRGPRGACASLLGLTAPPFAIVLALGWLYGSGHVPRWVGHLLAGMGAAAIGLMIATGLRMARGGITTLPPALLAAATAAGLAAGLPLIPVAAVGFAVALSLPAQR